MPTNNPRINVTLSPSLYALVSELGKLQRVSRATVLREFLEAVEPQLRQTVALMNAADRVSLEARAAFARDMEAGIKDAEQAAQVALQKAAGITRDLVAEAEGIRGRRPARVVSRPKVATPGRAATERAVPGAKEPRQRKDPPASNRGVKSSKTGRKRAARARVEDLSRSVANLPAARDEDFDFTFHGGDE